MPGLRSICSSTSVYHPVDLRQLEIVQAVAETGSFTGAGRKLHVSQSAISRQILLLEEEMTETIFLRVGRRIRITPAGESLLQLSHRVFGDIKETVTLIGESQQRLGGTIRLAGGMTVCMYVFPMLLQDYRRQHASIEVKLITGTSQRLLQEIRSGAADLGFITLPVTEPELVTVPAMEEEMLLVAHPSHPLARKHRIVPQDLVQQPFVLFEAVSNSRRILDGFFAKEGLEPRIVMETENVEIIKALVRSEMGITIIPYQAVAREVRSGQLFCARIAGASLVRHTGWVYQRSNRVPRMIQEMFKAYERVLPRLRLSPGKDLSSLKDRDMA
jgi:DNA-binding transcriptional LysR family regulator